MLRQASAQSWTSEYAVEAKDLVLGYMIIQARDLPQAAEIALGCPMAKGGALVEVRPIMTDPF